MSKLEDTLAWQMKVAGLPEPLREFVALKGRRYRWDFAFEAARLLVEARGGTATLKEKLAATAVKDEDVPE